MDTASTVHKLVKMFEIEYKTPFFTAWNNDIEEKLHSVNSLYGGSFSSCLRYVHIAKLSLRCSTARWSKKKNAILDFDISHL